MFKKGVVVHSQSQLKGSQARSLLSRIEATCAHCLAPGDAFVEVFSKESEWTVARISLGEAAATSTKKPADTEKFHVYAENGNPMFFEKTKSADSRAETAVAADQLLPSVYALWKLPNLLPFIVVPSHIWTFLERGAALMLPGVVNRQDPLLSRLPEGAACAVHLRGDDADDDFDATSFTIVAVGLLALPGSAISKQRSGKCLDILHIFSDALWALGRKGQPPVIACLASGEQRNTAAGDDEATTSEAPTAASSSVQDGAEAGDEAAALQTEAPRSLDTLTQDELAEYCLLTALKYRVKKDQLPMLVSTFYGSHMTSCCASGNPLEIKKTSWKKIAPLLAHYEEAGLITVQTVKGVASITSFQALHPLFIGYRRLSEAAASSASSSSSSSSSSASSSSSSNEPLIVIREGYCVPAPMIPIFAAVLPTPPKKGTTFFLKTEATQVLWKYVRERRIESTSDGRSILLDDSLAFLAEKGQGRQISKEKLSANFLQCLTSAHVIVANGTEILHKGAAPSIDIAAQKRKGHPVTVISGPFATFGLDPEEVSRRLQLHLAAAGSTQTGKPGDAIVLQGTHAKIPAFLTQTYGIPSKFFNSTIKEQAPKKKKNAR